jgi:hypothetical protein
VARDRIGNDTNVAVLRRPDQTVHRLGYSKHNKNEQQVEGQQKEKIALRQTWGSETDEISPDLFSRSIMRFVGDSHGWED